MVSTAHIARRTVSHSLHSADRATHLKIVSLAAVLTVAIVSVGLHARTDSSQIASRAPVKAIASVTFSSDSGRAIR
jgi:hypothetical protein